MKRIKTFKLWLLAVIGFLPVASVLAEQTVEVSTFAELEDALEAGNNGSGGRDVTIVLTANIDLSEDINAGHNGNVDRVYTFDFGVYTVDPGDYSIKLPVETQVRVTDPSFFSLFTLANDDDRHKLCYKLDEDGYYVAEALVPVVQVTGKEQYFASLADALTYTTGSIDLTLLKNVTTGDNINATFQGTLNDRAVVNLTQANCSIANITLYFKAYTRVISDKAFGSTVIYPATDAWMSTTEGNGKYIYDFYPYEAKVGNTPYKWFEKAVEEANGATITLLTDVASPYYICDEDQVIVVDETDEHFDYSVDVCDDLADYGMVISAVGEPGSPITTWLAEQGSVASITRLVDVSDPDVPEPEMEAQTICYPTFAEAVAAAGDEDVIDLLKNIPVTYVMATSATIRVRKGGFSLTVVAAEPSYWVDDSETEESADGPITIYKAALCEASITKVVDNEPVPTYYPTFALAAAAAGEGDVIDLLANVDEYTMPSVAGTTIKVRMGDYSIEYMDVDGAYCVVDKIDEDDNTVTVYSVVAAVASIDFFVKTDDPDAEPETYTVFYPTFAEAVNEAGGVMVIDLLQNAAYTMTADETIKVRLGVNNNLDISVSGAYVLTSTPDADDETVTVYTAEAAIASITTVVDDEPVPTYYVTFVAAANAAGENDVIDLLAQPDETDYFCLTTDGKTTLSVRKHGITPYVYSSSSNMLLDETKIEDAENGDITVYSLVAPVAYVDFSTVNEGWIYYATFAEAAEAAGENFVVTLLADIEKAYSMTPETTLRVQKGDYSLTVVVAGPYVVNEKPDEEDSSITVYTTQFVVASITEGTTTSYYTTFAGAVEAASNGRFVIVLLADVEETYTMNPGTIKVKKNGFDLTVEPNGLAVALGGCIFKTTGPDSEGVTTYTLAERTAVSLTVKPRAKENLTYTALKHNLIIPGVVKGGWLEYSLNPNTGFSETIPAKTEAGEYYVYYRVVPDDEHYGTDEDYDPIEVVIHKATVTPVVTIEGWTYGEEPNEPVIEGVVENGEVTFTYAAKGSDEFSTEVPEEAGTYVVKASVEQTPNYMFNDCTAEFCISLGELLLADDSDNSEAIDAAVATGSPYNVVLQGRTLYKDGTWNTLCLPFDLSAEQIAAGPLAGATIMSLDVEAKDGDVYLTRFEDNTLFMHFADADAITAGVPYIVKWAESENVTDPTFEGVVLSTADAVSVTSADEAIAFKGLFAPEGIYSADNNNLYLADDNNLYWPTAEDFTVNAFRAYFQLGTTSEAPVLRSILSFGEGATRINSTSTSTEENWYDLSGRQLTDRPAERGIYIVNGKKVVIK